MIQHFQYQSLYKNNKLPGWSFSFYFEKCKFEGIYHRDGKIEWTTELPPAADLQLIEKQIHELMLFHVYD